MDTPPSDRLRGVRRAVCHVCALDEHDAAWGRGRDALEDEFTLALAESTRCFVVERNRGGKSRQLTRRRRHARRVGTAVDAELLQRRHQVFFYSVRAADMRYVRLTKRQVVNWVGASVLPYLLLGISIWLTRTVFNVSGEMRGRSDLWIMAAGIVVGSLCVLHEFKWKGLAIVFGYVPFMVWSLFYFGLSFVGFFYDLYL